MIMLKQSLSSLLRAASRLDNKFYLVVNQWYHECLRSQIHIPSTQWEILAHVLDAVVVHIPNVSKRLEIFRNQMNQIQA